MARPNRGRRGRSSRKRTDESVPKRAIPQIGHYFHTAREPAQKANEFANTCSRIEAYMGEKNRDTVVTAMTQGYYPKDKPPVMPRRKKKPVSAEAQVEDSPPPPPTVTIPPKGIKEEVKGEGAEGVEATLDAPDDEVVSIDSDDPSEDESSVSSSGSDESDSSYLYESHMHLYREKLKIFCKREEDKERDRSFAVKVILAQCSEDMTNKLKARKKYKKIVAKSDYLALLDEIKTCSLDCSDEGYVVFNAVAASRDVMNCYQGKEEGIHEYKEWFDAAILRLEQMGGDLARLFDFNWSPEYKELSDRRKKDRLCAVLLVENSCKARFSGLKADLKKEAMGKLDTYPKDCAEALTRLNNHAPMPSPSPTPREDYTDPSSFAQLQKGPDGRALVEGVDGSLYPDVQCNYCKRHGHYKGQCPKSNRNKDEAEGKEEGRSEERDDKKDDGDKPNQKQGLSHAQWAEGMVYDDDTDGSYGGEGN